LEWKRKGVPRPWRNPRVLGAKVGNNWNARRFGQKRIPIHGDEEANNLRVKACPSFNLRKGSTSQNVHNYGGGGNVWDTLRKSINGHWEIIGGPKKGDFLAI